MKLIKGFAYLLGVVGIGSLCCLDSEQWVMFGLIGMLCLIGCLLAGLYIEYEEIEND